MKEPNIQIKNKRTYDGPGVYVGRPTPLGNPFEVGKHGARDDVIQKYRTWLSEAMEGDNRAMLMFTFMFDELVRDGDLTLICWCAPKSCHAEVIREFLLEAWNELQEEQS